VRKNSLQRYTILVAVVLLSFFYNLFSAPTPIESGNVVFYEGENLLYNVRYGFIDLGTVRMKTFGKFVKNGKTLWKVCSYIDSYQGVPFVDLHVIYESHIDESGYPSQFTARTFDDGKWYYTVYDFDQTQHKIFVTIGTGTKDVMKSATYRDTVAVNKKYQDGLSIFYYARQKSGLNMFEVIPTYQNEKVSTTDLQFSSSVSLTELDAVDYPVSIHYLEGKANFIGIFGLTGGFRGWFSSDDARVPILAKLNVLLGSVTFELIEWKRGTWTPPHSFDE